AAETEAAFKPAHLVSFSPTPSSTLNNRRLSSQFSKPSSPIRAGSTKKKTLAWVSLQGRLVGADEATSAQAIGGGLSREEADDILMSMQQKLDDLCEQMNSMKDQPQAIVDSSASKIMEFSSRRSSLASKSDSMCTDCWFCDQRRAELNDVSGNSLVKAASCDEMFKNRLSISNEAEQEERRMSDLSDWASSVTSVADLQLNNLAIEQDTYNLKRECEEKDAAIKDFSSFIRSKMLSLLNPIAFYNAFTSVPKSRPVSPLKEKSLNQTYHSVASPMPNKVSAGVGSKTNRRRTHSGSKMQ
uniref:Uncharacterized protein n=1 Tax=Chenopodium quinoa TaxID=63459 RepID=A0A803NBX2_CHEQI